MKKSTAALMKIASIILAVTLSTQTSVALADSKSTSGLPLKEKFSGFEGSKIVSEYVSLEDVSFYSKVVEDYSAKGYKPATVEIPVDMSGLRLDDGTAAGLETYEGKDGVFLWDGDIPTVEFDINVTESALYQLEFEYDLFLDSSNSAIRSLTVDDEYPFIESNNIVFYRYFKDKGEPGLNNLGDETRPAQVEIPGWRTTRATDVTGFANTPLLFYLAQGKHTLKIEYIQQNMALSSIKFVKPTNIPTYDELKASYSSMGCPLYSGDNMNFEAETNTIAKNSPTIRRETSGDPTVTPRAITNRKLNCFGGNIWRIGNQAATWEFEVPEDGLYKLGVYVQNNYGDGLPVYRQVAIDGEVPCQELIFYDFQYSTSWYLEEFKTESGESMMFYLEKGKHELTLTAKFGNVTNIIQSINDDTTLISKMLLDIILLAGSDPDPNYDYGFFDKIPDLEQNLRILADSMSKKYGMIKGLAKNTPAMANNFLTIKTQIDEMIADPFKIAKKVSDLENAQTSLSQWYVDLQRQPLLIDKFYVGSPEQTWKVKKANIFQRLYTTFANIFISFQKDYDNVGSILSSDVEIKNTINVWIARGTEWAEIIKEMADEEFTPKTGILININVLPSSQLTAGGANALMLSITSGKAPDVAMGVDSNSAVEFAIRDAVYDLSKMSEFDTVKDRFIDGIMVPYQYNGGVFALPETMDFNVLFYRKDLLAQMNLPVPDTREELYNYVLPQLYQNGMEFYYPKDATAVSKDFSPFLFQRGGSFYRDNGKTSALDTPEAYQAFLEYTQLYTNYGVPTVANFYNRMRSGEMPMGIGNFALFMQLSVAAPELAGKWGIAPLPGTKRADGVVDRTTGKFAGQCDIIMKQSDSPDDSWEFLKWWSSDEVQSRFARQVEAIVGAEARWNTANVNAFLNLSWKRDDIAVFKELWNWVQETPVVLGGYFTERHINNAWTSTVISGVTPREALEAAVKAINRELRMKQEEYGVFVDE